MPEDPCWFIVDTWALKGLPYHNFGVYVYTKKLHGAFGYEYGQRSSQYALGLPGAPRASLFTFPLLANPFSQASKAPSSRKKGPESYIHGKPANYDCLPGSMNDGLLVAIVACSLSFLAFQVGFLIMDSELPGDSNVVPLVLYVMAFLLGTSIKCPRQIHWSL